MPPLKIRSLARSLLARSRAALGPKGRFARRAARHLSAFLCSQRQLVFEPPQTPALSIILVLYNRAEFTLMCLEALGRSSFQDFEIIAIDNASCDRTQQLFSRVQGVKYVRNETNLHFLRGSNQGASLASAEYLLFLNNDAFLEPAALQAAMKTICADSEIAALGARLVLPDGTLQEAGSIVWQDGTCLGYGRGDKPELPQYMFRRDVDYCSGAFLLTPRLLFKRLGGFDLDFCPAYYEETDYCLRLKSAGYRIVYDPQILARHFEFASSASSADALAMQTERRRILCTKHAATLQKHLPSSPANVLLARSRPLDKPRLLFIDERLPHYHTGAGYPRANQMLRAALELGWHVSIYPAAHVDRHENWESLYSDIPRETEALAFAPYGPGRLRKLLEERAGYYNAILISRPTTMRLVRPLLEQTPGIFAAAKLIYDAEAIFSLREEIFARLSGRPLDAGDLQRRIAAEVSLARGAARISAVCRREADKFRQHGFEHVHVVSHAVNARDDGPAFSKRDTILFVGAIHDDHGPNADSVFWFIDKVLPHLRRSGLKAQLIIAGTNHSKRLRRSRIEGVQVLSWLPDLAQVYDRARIFIAPTRFSAGIPLKVIEAAANGVPAVVSPLVAEQLGWIDGKEVEIASSPEEFAARCRRLFLDEDLWDMLRKQSLARVRSEYSRESLRNSMLRLLT